MDCGDGFSLPLGCALIREWRQNWDAPWSVSLGQGGFLQAIYPLLTQFSASV